MEQVETDNTKTSTGIYPTISGNNVVTDIFLEVDITNSSNTTQDESKNIVEDAKQGSTVVEKPGITEKEFLTIFILCFINLINYMDRFTLAGVLDQVQCSFNITNTESGLLQTVLLASYMIFAPVFGFLGDRYSRRLIMSWGVCMWCFTTFLGSFCDKNFVLFTMFRAMVGVGEACYSTIAPTIISDMFVDDRRSNMLALFYFAIPVGSGLGYIVGSKTAYAFGAWQYALRVTPFLGIAAVFLILFVMVDPPRGEIEGSSELKPTSWSKDIKSLCLNPTFVTSSFGFTCVTFVAGALAWWGPLFITYGLAMQDNSDNFNRNNMDDVSFKFGVVTMMSGIIGVPLGAFVAQKLRAKYPRADPLICAFGLIMSTPLILAGAFMAQYDTVLCLTLIFFGGLLLNLNWSIVADILLYVVIPTRRATAEALQILLIHALGDAGSPYLIGVVSDSIKTLMYSRLPVPDDMEIFDGNNFTLNGSLEKSWNETDCTDTLDFTHPDINFISIQYALFITSGVEILGGIFFLLTAWFIVKDKTNCDLVIANCSAREYSSEENIGPEMSNIVMDNNNSSDANHGVTDVEAESQNIIATTSL